MNPMARVYLDDFEETSSEHPSDMDTNGSEDNESGSRSDQGNQVMIAVRKVMKMAKMIWVMIMAIS